MLTATNPATGQPIQTYEENSEREVAQKVEDAHQAFLNWRESIFPERVEKLRNASQILIDRKAEYAALMANEMGKPVRDGRAEIEKCAWVCDYYADHALSALQPEIIETDARRSYVSFNPLGVILAIMPWNYPFWQVFRLAAPALSAGNAVVLKHASNVPGCSQAIEDVFRSAQFPKDLFQNILLSSRSVDTLVAQPLVRAVTLTGSEGAGRAVAAGAGKLLKKTVLELGGSDPYIILEDADLEKTVASCVASRLLNSGQSCIAAKRFVVVESIRKRFEDMLTAQMEREKMGNPLEEDTEIGPLARLDLRDNLHRQVTQSIQNGARCLLGGRIPPGNGAFYPATVLSDVAKGMPAHDEETFGPVAAVIAARNEAEAIGIANDTAFGLGAAVFTEDTDRGERIAAEKLEAGSCFVNAFVKSDPRLPFGGIKQSGYGRELSHYGIKEFVNIKTVYVA
ncbi:MAG: NAD-dependent succinate-semialdehyde dehydrogenase [Desulfobacterales bacterium]|jgi:succinate-semialdehyde dehydrogenase/glutarate-semialdehyde dehydrogenase